MSVQHIIGPPGTGKTWTLMLILERKLAKIQPDQMLYCSFTRAAVREAQQRVYELFGLHEHDMPYFGTIHSLCYRHLGLNRSQVALRKHRKDFCEALSLRFTDTNGNDDLALYEPWEPAGQEEGDILFQWYDWARNCCLPLEESARVFPEKHALPDHVYWSVERALRFAAEWEWYKQEKGLLDFPQMLEEVYREGWRPPVKVLVLDEAQDLSPLQQKLFLHWSGNGAEVILGYDEDQAVYSFQGADPAWLLELPGERVFLDQSYRVPQKPAEIAGRIISRNQARYPKEWKPKEDRGQVAFDVDFEDLVPFLYDCSEKWFLLARNNVFLERYTQVLQQYGIPYVNLRGNSPLMRLPAAVTAAIRLAEGRAITLNELRLLAEHTAARTWWQRGTKSEITRRTKETPNLPVRAGDLTLLGALSELAEAMQDTSTCLGPLKIAEGNKTYLLKVYFRYGMSGLENPPHVVLSSIHGVKGREADNVVLAPDMTRRTYEGYTSDCEPERRVWYVGITRTRNRLFVLCPRKWRCFEEW